MPKSRQIPFGVFLIAIGTSILLGALAMAVLVSFAQTPLWCGADPNDSPCMREWIGAIGGWFGGLVAVPTLYLLRIQTAAHQQQVAISKAPHYTRQIERLKEDAATSRNTIRDLYAKLSIDYSKFAHRNEDSLDYAFNHARIGARIIRNQRMELRNTFSNRPILKMDEFRKACDLELLSVEKKMSALSIELRKTLREMKVNPDILQFPHIQRAEDDIEKICDLTTVGPLLFKWEEASISEVERYESLLARVHEDH